MYSQINQERNIGGIGRIIIRYTNAIRIIPNCWFPNILDDHLIVVIILAVRLHMKFKRVKKFDGENEREHWRPDTTLNVENITLLVIRS